MEKLEMYMKNMTRFAGFSVIYGGVIVILGLIAGCGEESSNSPPVIDSFEASSVDVAINSEVTLTVFATDADGDDLIYTYQSTGGEISGTGNVVRWIAPATAGNYTITADISDGKLNAENLITITVVEGEVVEKEEAVEEEVVKEEVVEEAVIVDDVTMVLIPAGEFQMGDHFNEGDSDELPVHTVYLDAFYMDIYEVTNAQYQEFMNATGHSVPAEYWNNSRYNAPDQPIVGVRWHDAVAYAEWAGKRLPTEAEWEKAARGGLSGKRFPWGDSNPDDAQCNFADSNTNYSWSDGSVDDDYKYTAPVGSYLPNDYGLYNMAGNVWEWCADWYNSDYYSNSPGNNPTGPRFGTIRVLRGGSWYGHPLNLRVAGRGYGKPTFPYYGMGFRCVSQD